MIETTSPKIAKSKLVKSKQTVFITEKTRKTNIKKFIKLPSQVRNSLGIL